MEDCVENRDEGLDKTPCQYRKGQTPSRPNSIRQIIVVRTMGSLACFAAVFMIVFAAAEAAVERPYPVYFEDTSSLLKAEYSAWAASEHFSIRAGFIEDLKSGNVYGLKNPQALQLDFSDQDGFLVPDSQIAPVDYPVRGAGDQDGDDFSDEETLVSDEVDHQSGEEALQGVEDDSFQDPDSFGGGNILDSDPALVLPEDVQDVLNELGVSVGDELDVEETRVIMDEVRDEFLAEEGRWRDADPGLMDQFRELQDFWIQDHPGFPDQ